MDKWAVSFVVLALATFGQTQQMRLPAVQLAKPPVIDGVLSEGEWTGATRATGFIDLYAKKPAKDQTEMWLAYDKDYIYAAFKMYDSDPSKIVALATQPNALSSDDRIVLYIDPVNKRDYASFSSFACTPKGIQSETIAGGRSAKREWRGLWDSKANIVSDGWIAEMRIPWKVLNLPNAGKHDVAFYVCRNQISAAISSYLPDLTEQMWIEKAATWEGVQFVAGARPRPSFQAYALSEFTDDKSNLQIGGDIRYQITPRLMAVGTIRPDFANVEQSVASIEFTHQERYLDDSRPFFNEGDSYLGMIDGASVLFYTRRIADFDYGAKVFGNIDDRNEIGALVAQTGSDRTDAAMRYCYKFGPRQSFTFYGTSTDNPSLSSRTIGSQYFYGNGPISLRLAQSLVDNDKDIDYSYVGSIGYFRGKWSVSAGYLSVDPGFYPALGYVTFNDRRGLSAYSSYEDVRRGKYLRYIYGNLSTSSYEHFNGSNQLDEVSMNIYAFTKNNANLSFSVDSACYDQVYELTTGLGIGSSSTDGTRYAGLSGNFGKRGGNKTSYLSANLSTRVSKKVDVGITFAQQQYLGLAEQTILTVGWIIDPKRTLTARTVYSQGKTNAYLAYKSAGFIGMDWYLIVGDPNALEWKDRIVAKLVWAW